MLTVNIALAILLVILLCLVIGYFYNSYKQNGKKILTDTENFEDSTVNPTTQSPQTTRLETKTTPPQQATTTSQQTTTTPQQTTTPPQQTTTTTATDIKTLLYTDLPESIEDFDNIKNSIGYYKLENGLEVILLNCPGDDDNKLTVEANINTGSINDPEGYHELSHFVEHLIFDKTKNFNSIMDIQKFIPLADYNGFTDQVNIGIRWNLSTANKDEIMNMSYLLKMLYVLKEIIYNADIAGNNLFEKTKNIVMREYDIRIDDLSSDHENIISKNLYKNTEFRKFFDSSTDDINNITREMAVDYYKTNFRPNNMRIFIYGNLPNWPFDDKSTNNTVKNPSTTKSSEDEENTRKKNIYGWILQKYFVTNQDDPIKMDDLVTTSMIVNNNNKKGFEYTFDIATIINWLKQSQNRLLSQNKQPTIEYVIKGPIEKIINDTRLTQSKLYMVFKHPYFKNKQLHEAVPIINKIFNKKLFDVLRLQNGLIYGIEISDYYNDNIFNEYWISCNCKSDEIDKVKLMLLDQLKLLQAGNYFTDEEYNIYKMKNKEYNDKKTECKDFYSSSNDEYNLESIKYEYRLINTKFKNNIYSTITLDILNKIAAFIFDPNVCEIFIFTNDSTKPSVV